MKNVYKIFTALFLTLNIMPVLAAGPLETPLDTSVIQQDLSETIIENIQKISNQSTNYLDNVIKQNQEYYTPAPANPDSRYPIANDEEKNTIQNILTTGEPQFIIPSTPDPDNGTTSETKTKESCTIDNALLTRRDKTGKCYVVTCKPGYKHNSNKTKCVENKKEENKQNRTSSDTESSKASPTKPVDTRTNEEKQKALDEKQTAYDEAKENQMLTAATTVATGIGGIELARGLSEQSADKDAEQNMSAYLATFRCKYGDAEPVKAGPDEIELPGGNDANMIKYRNEYFALANDLKERKNALGMNPGIENQEILDKSQTGLYDDESVGITSGAYASLYRAQMLNSEQDQQQIDEEKKKSKNRVIAGAVVGGVGVVGGAVGDSLINGKLGEKIKEKKETEAASKENQEVIDLLIKKLTKGGITNAKDLDFLRYNLSGLRDDISEIDPAKLSPFKGRNASQLINTSSRTTLANSLESLIYNNDFQQNFDKINQKNTRNDFFRAPSNNPTPTINFTPSSLDINMFDSK